MKPFLSLLATASIVGAGTLLGPVPASAQQTIKIGVPTSVQLQVGRDTQNAIKMAIEDINSKGGLVGRKLEMVAADETENPEQGIAAIKKLTADEKVDVLIGGYTSGVTLAQLPHIANAKTIYLGVGAASPAITAKVKADYENYKYIFRVSPIHAGHQARALVDFINGKLKGEMGLKKGAVEGGTEVPMAEFFDTSTSDFSPLFAKVKASGAQYLIVILSHASSDIFVKQWHDAQVPIPIGGIDVKSQDADFFTRVSGKALSETVGLFATRAPLTPKTIPFWDEFVKRFGTAPVYTGVGAYDAIYVYAEAVKRANSVEPSAVIKELEKTDYVGIAGKIQFDEVHDVKQGPGLQNLLFAQWQKDGQRIVVWPKASETGKMIPPPWMN